MKILCLEPIINSGQIISFVLYKNFSFSHQHILNIKKNKIPKTYIENECKLCFDFFKLYNTIEDVGFFYDVGILYSLKNIKHSNIIELSNIVLGEEKTNEYKKISDKIKSHLNSYKNAKIDIKNFESKFLFPNGLLEELYRKRSEIVKDLYLNFNEPDIKEFYKNHFFKFLMHFYNISNNKLLIKENENKAYKDKKYRIKIHPVGAKTGRLTCFRDSINIYNMSQKARRFVLAHDNYNIVQFDYSSFQPRLAIFSTKNKKFEEKFKEVEDIYSVFNGDRNKNKLSFLAWMFSNYTNSRFDSVAKPIRNLREKICKEVDEKGKIKNFFGRILFLKDEPNNVIFQNFICSLEVDFVLNVMHSINNFLKEGKYSSRLLFPFHDSIVFEIHDGEKFLVQEIKNRMEYFYMNDIFYNKFPVTIKKGKNFGEMYGNFQ